MRIKITEVWNGGTEKQQELAIIEAPNHPIQARQSVYAWIGKNRPDLDLCTSINGHGYHAIAV